MKIVSKAFIYRLGIKKGQLHSVQRACTLLCIPSFTVHHGSHDIPEEVSFEVSSCRVNEKDLPTTLNGILHIEKNNEQLWQLFSHLLSQGFPYQVTFQACIGMRCRHASKDIL